MATKSGKFTITLIASLFILLLFLAGASAINASAAQAELSDDRSNSSQESPSSDSRQGNEVEFFGTIQAIDGSSWTISGLTVAVRPGAEIKGELKVGDQVKVHAFRSTDGLLVVREIAASAGVFDQSGSANSNANFNGDDNSNTSDDSNANLNGDDNGNGSDDGNANLNGDDNGSDDGNSNLNSNDDDGNANDDDDDEDNSNANDDDDDDDNDNANDDDPGDENGNGSSGG